MATGRSPYLTILLVRRHALATGRDQRIAHDRVRHVAAQLQGPLPLPCAAADDHEGRVNLGDGSKAGCTPWEAGAAPGDFAMDSSWKQRSDVNVLKYIWICPAFSGLTVIMI